MTPPPRAKTCVVTGASGYLGSRISQALRAEKQDLVPLGRFRLGDDVDPASLRGVDALIHCAYDFRAVTQADIWRINVEGTRKLLDAASAARVPRVVVISSMAAYEGCRSLYGQAKLAIEKHATSVGAVSVRPGLIYGDQPGGMVGTLNRILGLSPIVPLIGSGDSILYLAQEDDLCRLVVRLVTTTESLPPVITAASPRAFRFREILQMLAAKKGRRAAFLPIPWRLVHGLLKGAELAHLPIGMRSDSVVSLIHSDPAPDFSGAHALGVSFREFV